MTATHDENVALRSERVRKRIYDAAFKEERLRGTGMDRGRIADGVYEVERIVAERWIGFTHRGQRGYSHISPDPIEALSEWCLS